MTIRIGRIAYANCTPIFHGLAARLPADGFQLHEGVPSELNAKLSAGEIDVCPSSSFAYALSPASYLILPGLSISSDGPVGSVLLFSRLPLEDLESKTILLSSESATSVNLLRILVRKRYGINCRFAVSTLSLDEGLESAPAMLLIGDSALKESLRSTCLVYDLGFLWKEWTGLPFVFALWLCRRVVADECRDEIISLASLLLTSKVHTEESYRQLASIVPEASWMGEERLTAYWRDNISFDLDERHIEGLSLFFRYCAELGLLPAAPALNFLELS